MGWLGGWFGGNSSDPVAKLDPKLREFLEKESPTKHAPATPAPTPAPKAQPPAPKPQTKAPSPTPAELSQPAAPAAEEPRKLPKESLYQDGRYAHLWKTYRPLADIENETKSDHEKMMDLLQDYKARKSAIGRTALENCAEEQADWASCMKSGDIGDRFTMCRDQVRKFERCYMVQSKMLKALGYLSMGTERTQEEDEKIQMHADKLYHQMLEREAAIAKAKEEGKPVPTFGPLTTAPAGQTSPQSETAAAVAAAAAASQAQTPALSAPKPDEDDPLARYLQNDKRKAKWDEQIAKMTPEEQRAEEAAMREELRANKQVQARLDKMWEQRKEERQERLQKGTATIGDRVAQIFGRT